MSQIVDLATRETVEAPRATKTPTTKLRELLDKMDAGEIDVLSWMFIYDKVSERDQSLTATGSLDSDLKISEVIYMLENHKFDLMIMARDVAK